MVASGSFREDLYYRLNVVNIRIPPLRERPEDIPLLAVHHLEISALRLGRPKPQLAEETLALLRAYTWPGNVRELENEMERAVALSVSITVTPEDLSEPLRQAIYHPPVSGIYGDAMRQTEAELIRSTLAKASNNKSKAARILGITREGLRKKMKRLGISE
jgi:DNA-binding NtrC family response regulator